jgi:L-seryl-tRNA(Ser) seleniumtransferase
MSESIYAKLGVRSVINGMGTYTALGGSLMPPEVIAAMAEAARGFVCMAELQAKAGERIAKLLNVPAAMVTAGAASAITVAAAACISRGDDEVLRRLPLHNGMKPEVIIQRTHYSGYEAQLQLTGARLV